MKNLIITIALSIASLSASAQSIHRIRYKVDTVKFEGLTAPIRRTSGAEQAKYMTSGSINFTVAQAIADYENSVKDVYSYIEHRREIGWIPFLQEQVNKMRRALPDFNTQEYDQEIAFYNQYNQILRGREMAAKRRDDSLRLAAVALQAQKDQERKRVNDSVTYVKDSLREAENDANYKSWVQQCIKKYGKKNGQLVADGFVTMGMSKQMVIDAWGEASHKIINSTGEKWTYSYTRWVRLKNGIVVELAGSN